MTQPDAEHHTQFDILTRKQVFWICCDGGIDNPNGLTQTDGWMNVNDSRQNAKPTNWFENEIGESNLVELFG